MDREETILSIIISLFIIFIAYSNENLLTDDLIKYIIICTTFVVMELLSYFSYKYRKIIKLFEFILLIVLVNSGIEIIILLAPSIIYSLSIKKYIKIFYLVSIVGLLKIISLEYIGLFLLHALIIYLYMDSLYKKETSEKELKNHYKTEREENNKLIEKIAYMDNYRRHTNTMAQINERSYIAQSLHDKLGHSVTSSIMQLHVSKSMMNKDKNLSMEYLNGAIENLTDGMDDIRLVLKNLKPQEEIIGIEVIKTLLSEFQNNSGIFTGLKVTGDIKVIESSYWIVIEDNLKEALTNAYKYSSATKVEMCIEVYNKFVRIEINDNGKGVNKIVKGLGLRGMEERIKSIDGTINFFGSDGFSISMIIGL